VLGVQLVLFLHLGGSLLSDMLHKYLYMVVMFLHLWPYVHSGSLCTNNISCIYPHGRVVIAAYVNSFSLSFFRQQYNMSLPKSFKLSLTLVFGL
jgi:hypothetical protein